MLRNPARRRTLEIAAWTALTLAVGIIVAVLAAPVPRGRHRAGRPARAGLPAGPAPAPADVPAPIDLHRIVSTRFGAAELEAVKAAAEEAGVSVSELIRRATVAAVAERPGSGTGSETGKSGIDHSVLL